MKSRIVIPFSVIRACDHTEIQNIEYLDTKEKRELIDYHRSKLCTQCTNSLLETMGIDGPSLSFELSELTGSPAQIKWASSIRSSVAKTALKSMYQLNKRADAIANSCLVGMYLVLMQNESSIWISHRDMNFNSAYFVGNAGIFTKYRKYAILFDGRPVKGHIIKNNPERARIIISSLLEKKSPC